jgi:hypothetical protein
MRPYLHDEICKIAHTHRSCSQVVDLTTHGHRTSSIFVDGLENLFLACEETTMLLSLTCTFGLQEHSASGRKNNDRWTQDEELFILKIMIIGHWMELFILMPRGSGLPSPDTAMQKDVCHKNSSGSCVRGMSNPITHITRIFLATKRSRRRKKREKQKLAPYKIYSLRHS